MQDRCIIEITDRATLDVVGRACGRWDRRAELERLALRHLDRYGAPTTEPLAALEDTIWINVYREKR